MSKNVKLKFRLITFFILFLAFISAPLYSYAVETGVTINFDVNPKNLLNIPPNDRAVAINKVDINLSKYGAYCGDLNINRFKYYVMWDYSSIIGGRDKELYSETVSFSRTSADVSLNFSKTFTANIGAGTQKLYGMIECPNGKNVIESSRVNVFVAIGSKTWSCIGPNSSGKNVYICSPSNLSNCSDAPQCVGKTCSQIPSGLCGRETGTGGGNPVPGPGNPQPGEPVSVSFNIPNPIQAESLVDLAKAIGKFLFQIAIPIAVIIIIYAGILFLTSGGNKDKAKKAGLALWYAVIGLAIILIGQGFFTLIKSILNLGG